MSTTPYKSRPRKKNHPGSQSTPRVFKIQDIQNDEENKISILNVPTDIRRNVDEPERVFQGQATYDLVDVVMVAPNTRANIVVEETDPLDPPNLADRNVATVSRIPGTDLVAPNSEADVSVDAYYDGDGNTVFVLTDGDDVIGVRG